MGYGVKDRQQTKQNKPAPTYKAIISLPPSERKAGKRLLYKFYRYTTRLHTWQTLLQDA